MNIPAHRRRLQARTVEGTEKVVGYIMLLLGFAAAVGLIWLVTHWR